MIWVPQLQSLKLSDYGCRDFIVIFLKFLSKNKKALQLKSCEVFYFIGRNGGIRTRDPLHPMQVRYQAALRSERGRLYRFFAVKQSTWLIMALFEQGGGAAFGLPLNRSGLFFDFICG